MAAACVSLRVFTFVVGLLLLQPIGRTPSVRNSKRERKRVKPFGDVLEDDLEGMDVNVEDDDDDVDIDMPRCVQALLAQVLAFVVGWSVRLQLSSAPHDVGFAWPLCLTAHCGVVCVGVFRSKSGTRSRPKVKKAAAAPHVERPKKKPSKRCVATACVTVASACATYSLLCCGFDSGPHVAMMMICQRSRRLA